MKEILFVIQLSLPGMGTLPPDFTPMPSIEACYERVAAATQDFLKIEGEVFQFAAGCVVVSKKPPGDPA